MQGAMPLSVRAARNPLPVVASVGDQRRGRRERIEKKAGALMIAHLAFREHQDDGPALAVADGVQLRVQAAFGAPEAAGNIPFL